MAKTEKPERRGRTILVVMTIIVIASLWRTVSVEQSSQQVSKDYQELQARVEYLQTERGDLRESLLGSRRQSKGQANNLGTLQQELRGVQDELDEALREIASLNREYDRLQDENQSLTTRLSSVTEEKSELEGRFSSLTELKLAIREVKRKVWEDRWARWSAPWQERRHLRRHADNTMSGNGGYVVKQGKSTLGDSPTMHVRVLEPQFP